MDRLDYHAGNQERDMEVPSFVGMLRPYSELRQEAYDDVMQCLRDLAPLIRTATSIEKPLAASLFALTWYARYWALEPDSMLRRNDLLSAPAQDRLTTWVHQLSHTISQLLEGATDEEAFSAP